MLRVYTVADEPFDARFVLMLSSPDDRRGRIPDRDGGGQNQRILARTEHYEIAASAWMAAKFKFPHENLQLRKKAQLMQRHDGAPKPDKAPDPRLPDWDVNLIVSV